MKQLPTARIFSELAAFDSCTIANAVDSFKVRLLNEGFSGAGISCRAEAGAPMVGEALTLKMRSAEPSMKPGFYLQGLDWWERIEESSVPRVLVIEDTDAHPGRGSLVGPVHACIIKALGFVGVVTTGAIRGRQKFADLKLQAFSGSVSPAHAYGHVIEMGGAVDVAGMRIKAGDLIHGDRDGIVSIPADLVLRIPDAARLVSAREQRICEYCSSREFSRAGLKRAISTDPSRW